MGRSERDGRAISAALVITFAQEKRGERQKGRSSGKTREWENKPVVLCELDHNTDGQMRMTMETRKC